MSGGLVSGGEGGVCPRTTLVDIVCNRLIEQTLLRH